MSNWNELAYRALEFLEREGYRRCDVPACNCGAWHKIDRPETKLVDILPDLIEPPLVLNWPRQNYCSGWNQCVHETQRRIKRIFNDEQIGAIELLAWMLSQKLVVNGERLLTHCAIYELKNFYDRQWEGES